MPLRFRECITRLAPYIPGKSIEEVQRELGLNEVIKLASNENPLGPSPKAVAAITKSASSVHYYPDASGFALKGALSDRFGVSGASVVLGSGSDELIHNLCMLLLEPGDEAAMADPGFPRYEASTKLAGAVALKVPLDPNEKHDLDAIANAITERTKLVFIANPNNPTGTIVRRADMDRFLDAIPDTVLPVLDEAYFDFVCDDDYPNSLEYVKAGRQIVGLRTFSKSHGLAGLRVGYAFGPEQICKPLECIRAPFNVNSLAQAAALAALGDDSHLKKTVQLSRAAVILLTDLLRKHGAKVAESHANFIWADIGRPADSVCSSLMQQGFIVRPGTIFGRPNCMRISVGTEEQMAAFYLALQSAIKVTVAV